MVLVEELSMILSIEKLGNISNKLGDLIVPLLFFPYSVNYSNNIQN
jgi:hypothetical protein